MRIGFDGKFFSASAGKQLAKSGNGVHSYELLRHAMTIDDENEYVIYLLDEDRPFTPPTNFHYRVLPRMSMSSTLRNVIAYPLELARRPVDVLISFSTTPVIVPCKSVLLLADIFWFPHPEWLPRRLALPRTLATRLSSRQADRIVTHSEFSKAEIIEHLGVPADKVEVVHHGIRDQFLERLPQSTVDAVKARYGIRDSYILSVNDIHPRKNLEGLVSAFVKLKDDHRIPHQLVITGRPLWPYPSFFQRLDSLGRGDQILLTGYVPFTDLRALYQAASLFVYPSFYEGYGLQVHEAMASGAPVAIANASSLPEVAGEAAARFDPNELESIVAVLAEVLGDDERRKRMIDEGYEQLRKFSWVDSTRRLLEICRDVYDG